MGGRGVPLQRCSGPALSEVEWGKLYATVSFGGAERKRMDSLSPGCTIISVSAHRILFW